MTLGVGGCAQPPQQFAVASHGKEYFPSAKYGAASRRVVADGAPIPRGGGQYLVGRPYTVAGQTYYPSERHVVQVGTASWYGDAFHGRLTANGEIYDKNSFTAAHPTMPLPSYARVTNLRNNSSMIVRVNDRGPYASNRVMDVSGHVAEALDFKRYGTAKIKVEYVGRASLAGSDDARLFATLRSNGPAQWQGEPTMVAAAEPPARVASLAPYVPEPRHEPKHVAQDTAERNPETGDPRPVAVPRPAREASPKHVVTSRPDGHEPYELHGGHRPNVAPEPPRFERLASRDGRHDVSTRITTTHERHGAAILPPSRPMDLGTIPGADSRIVAHRAVAGDPRNSHRVPLRLARSRDD